MEALRIAVTDEEPNHGDHATDNVPRWVIGYGYYTEAELPDCESAMSDAQFGRQQETAGQSRPLTPIPHSYAYGRYINLNDTTSSSDNGMGGLSAVYETPTRTTSQDTAWSQGSSKRRLSATGESDSTPSKKRELTHNRVRHRIPDHGRIPPFSDVDAEVDDGEDVEWERLISTLTGSQQQVMAANSIGPASETPVFRGRMMVSSRSV